MNKKLSEIKDHHAFLFHKEIIFTHLIYSSFTILLAKEENATNPPLGKSTFAIYEGLPSDYYPWLTGMGCKMLRKEIPLSESKPDDLKN